MHLKLYNKKITDSKSNMAEPRDVSSSDVTGSRVLHPCISMT